MGATKADFPYYYYHIDILLILILFCGLTFMIGYFGKEEKNVQLINVNSNRAYPIGNTMNATPSSKSPNLFVSSPSGTNLGPPPPSPPIPLSKVKSRDVFGITTSAYVPTQKERVSRQFSRFAKTAPPSPPLSKLLLITRSWSAAHSLQLQRLL